MIQRHSRRQFLSRSSRFAQGAARLPADQKLRVACVSYGGRGRDVDSAHAKSIYDSYLS